ncbi:uncharacterized protein Bfra_001895 [Botrytis fragariae]|uniref:Uncharacterized protein n=1 Tax=Botrytis fragariae TaxID=1964551 RepID=A0A8H6B1Q2_9HELO|nr:uncharacterized protein Bfra_001895 [Botrytis fragariae]KAF5877528.1 hypothetical protein Bfra_001895 [Botrytis fragariae]
MNTQRHNRPPPQTVEIDFYTLVPSIHGCANFELLAQFALQVSAYTNQVITKFSLILIEMDNHPFVDDAKNIPC